ncbi:MAG: cytochrome c maturation protein CcmE [Alphaproteobacteria bacterium]|nr:cytochrome c maturation protein CcmE [Alphaproteobacteria bacterium]
MTRKQTRLTVILSGLALLGVALGLMLFAMRDSIVFFYTPSEMADKHIAPGTRVRLGGLVEQGSLVKGTDGQVSFAITDMTKTIKVSYKGLLPDLFREGQGVVAEGSGTADGAFKADSVLAKHDEKYMPKEIVDKLKAQGVWREGKG